MKTNTTHNQEFELLFFSVDVNLVSKAVNAGVDGVIVDWENQGKKSRQKDFDTQINHNTYEDLLRVRAIVPNGKLLCRLNGFNTRDSLAEIDRALLGGADELFLPMVRHPEEVEAVLNHCHGNAPLSILIETTEALSHLDDFASLPLKRVYVGLNDLHIQQNSPNIFYPLIDGTIARIREKFDCPLGVGGVTRPGSGFPVESSFLINEYARLAVDFSFLRRTFIRDANDSDMGEMVAAIKNSYKIASVRTKDQEEKDFLEFRKKVNSWRANPYLS